MLERIKPIRTDCYRTKSSTKRKSNFRIVDHKWTRPRLAVPKLFNSRDWLPYQLDVTRTPLLREEGVRADYGVAESCAGAMLFSHDVLQTQMHTSCHPPHNLIRNFGRERYRSRGQIELDRIPR